MLSNHSASIPPSSYSFSIVSRGWVLKSSCSSNICSFKKTRAFIHAKIYARYSIFRIGRGKLFKRSDSILTYAENSPLAIKSWKDSFVLLPLRPRVNFQIPRSLPLFPGCKTAHVTRSKVAKGRLHLVRFQAESCKYRKRQVWERRGEEKEWKFLARTKEA